MGKPLTIQEADDERLEALKAGIGARTKVEVLRRALDVLEGEIRRRVRGERLKEAASIVSSESLKVNREFQTHSLLRKKW